MPEPRSVRRGRSVAGGFVSILACLATIHAPATLLAQVQTQISDVPGSYGGQGSVQAVPLSSGPYGTFPPSANQPAIPYPGQASPPGYAPPQQVPSVPLGAPYGAAPAGPAPRLGQPQNLPPQLPPTDSASAAIGPSAAVDDESPVAEGEIFESAMVVARVGRETILAGDILGMVNQQIQAAEKTVPKEQLPAFRKEAEKFRRRQMAQLTQLSIEMKLLYWDFLRLVPPERQLELKNKIGASFREYEAPKMMESFEVDSEEALDAKLRTFGSSLKKAQQLYTEKTLGMILLKQKIDDDPKVSHQELLDLYESKKDSYFRPARVKYEELVVKISKFANDKAAAWAEIADIGNEVLRGAPLSAVAKRRSHGIGAATSGGKSDWTGRGSLVTTKVEEALFTIPIGELSEIIEDGDAFYIVRALERENERYTPFDEVQEDLRDEIQEEKLNKAREEYLLGLYERTHVWNAFQHENVQSLAERRREMLQEGSAPLYLLGNNDKAKAAVAGSAAKPEAGTGSVPSEVPGGGSFEPAPLDFQPSPAPMGGPPAGEYEFR
ncbi:MAG TPA: peptidyl-prolyl cis-trans isomerase [Pirellulaceae bacterium]|nr:peptidyl-prolyl cis-trans isomerase [Pirellulaceae bacterium]